MYQTTKRILLTILTILFLLAACVPLSAPTQSPEQIQQQIAEAVALTVAAQNAMTEAAQPIQAPATNTPLPTQTEPGSASPTPVLPTATPFIILPPTSTVVSSGGGSGVVTQPDYACNAILRRPFDKETFRPDADFDIKWTIVNTGKKAWRAGLDLKYLSGPQMTSVTRVELPALQPGERFEVILDAEAPSKRGFYVMTWVVEGQLCYPYVAINVEK
ncbi:MAG TPA: NBR1-Ig-like domain-containing protein [Anaerolineales bacterium]|nr:NBR1-Ig-like domain-containing protein [Anaerolineales bacterium]